MTDGPLTEQRVLELLAGLADPETGRNIVQAGQVHQLKVDGQHLQITLGLTTHSAPLWNETRQQVLDLLEKHFPQAHCAVELAVHARPAPRTGELALPVKTVVAVGSGKGGVGKSSVAACLAYGLRRAGSHVGLLDADLYGPSIPQLLGIHQQPRFSNGRIEPLEVDGLNVMSIGLLIPRQEAVIWRGPMLHSALRQLLGDTDWGELDYLIVDLPPGTGDVAISLSQLVPTAAAVVVCTPQDVALLDATRAITMFRRMNMEILGMVENMSFFICTNCNARHEVFGCGGAKRRAAELGVAFLGELPLVTQLRVLGDEGRLTEAFGLPGVKEYLEELCRQLVREIADRRRRNPHMPTLPIVDRPFPRQSET
mgnify:CR=1 FL=1